MVGVCVGLTICHSDTGKGVVLGLGLTVACGVVSLY